MLDDFPTNATNRCLDCGESLPAALSTRPGEGPESGAISVCIICAGLAIFTNDLSLRPLTVEEELELAADAQLQRVRELIRDESRKWGYL